ncbi:hypothetical protein HELRODRAFT_188771 [Helobdella robusta]|uniref:Microtubule-associated protein Jupiter n=1 Tax=Helobdella robusta TaxID=6412 RepID=T1FQC2_HELRO|nr:hypothetical protein HELRODRAFT_188771 [Helobdella robusta]ESO02603.1 hypothetical protein HELRODRAFT_188771 [Helobdella robusta]
MNSIEHMDKPKRNPQPPGGASSMIFGPYPTEVIKPRNNHTASTIFDSDNQENLDKRNVDVNNNFSPNVQNEIVSEKSVHEKNFKKQGFNPITGENYCQSAAENGVSGDKTNVKPKATGAPVTPPIMTSRRQPPGGKSSMLW